MTDETVCDNYPKEIIIMAEKKDDRSPAGKLYDWVTDGIQERMREKTKQVIRDNVTNPKSNPNRQKNGEYN